MLNSRGFVPSPSALVVPLRIAAALLAMQLLPACGGPSEGTSADYDITFTISDFPASDQADLSRLSFKVEYDGGSFVGNGNAVSCELASSLNNNTTNNNNNNKKLTVDVDLTDSTDMIA